MSNRFNGFTQDEICMINSKAEPGNKFDMIIIFSFCALSIHGFLIGFHFDRVCFAYHLSSTFGPYLVRIPHEI